MRFQLGRKILTIIVLSCLASVTTQCAERTTSVQKQLPGVCAKELGVGKNSSIWAIGCGKANETGDFYLFTWNDSKWDMISGFGSDIAVEPNGTPWITNSGGQIYKRSSNGWQGIPGCARDIGVGANGSAWILGCKQTGAGNFEILSWQGSGWNRVEGAATRIAVEPNGTPWIVNSRGQIYKRNGNAWQQVPGCAKDIGVGENGSAWILGCKQVAAGGFEILYRKGTGWNKVPGAATGIVVEPNGTPWVISIEGKVFRL
jgi:hypothetical protein